MNDTLTHRYEPWGTVKDLFQARSDEVLMSGPAGTGKSRGCLEKLMVQALRYPKMRGLIVRKTAATLGSTALVTWRQHVVPELMQAGQVTYYGGSAQEPPQFRFSNGSVICIAGMDKASKVMSSEYDVIYVQEATELTEDDWEKLTTRLRNGVMPYQQLIADCNPDTEYHWLKQRFDKGMTQVIHAKHTDNPTLYTRDGQPTREGRVYLEKLSRLSGVRRLRLEKGLWVAAEGLIYEEWDPTVHLVDPFPVPADWDRYWVIDFGYRNPFVCQFWAEDPDGRLYLYREIYMTGRTVEDHAQQILKCVTAQTGPRKGQWKEPRPRQIICDHDAEGRATLEKHLELGTDAAHKGVTDGIQAVQSRLKEQGDGKPGLFLMRGALVERDPHLEDQKKPLCTEQEIVGYVWLQKPGQQQLKEEPLKENDHGMDCMRYLVAEKDLYGGFSMAWL
jgi:phage terminase large subunit